MEPKKELTLVRTLNAPREKVWQAWSDPKLVQQWWGPRGVTNPICQWNVKVGEPLYIVMLAGKELGRVAGQEWPMKGTMLEVVPEEKIVFSGGPIAEGTLLLEQICTVTFAEENGKTKVTVHIEITKTTPEAAGPLSGMEQGWNQQMDKLVEFLS